VKAISSLQSLGRVIASKSNPTVTLTKNVRTDVQEAIAQSRSVDGDLDRVQATVSPEQGLYIINFPSIDKQFVLDIQHPFDDDEGDTVFPVTDWILGGTIGALLGYSAVRSAHY
jgi:hypothetical protein